METLDPCSIDAETGVEDSILLYYVVVWGVIRLMYYTEFTLFEIYFMLFHVMSSNSHLILLSACGEQVPARFTPKETSSENE